MMNDNLYDWYAEVGWLYCLISTFIGFFSPYYILFNLIFVLPVIIYVMEKPPEK